MATIRPVLAATVPRNGRPTIRAEPGVARLPLRLVEDLHERRARRLVAELLPDLAVDGFQVPGDVGNQAGVGLVVLDHEMRRGAGLHGIEHVEHVQRVLHADVERIGVEGLLEQRAGIGLAAHPHQQQAQPGVRFGLPRQEANGLAEIAFRGGVPVADLQHLGQLGVELAGVRVPLDDFRRQGIEPRAGVWASARSGCSLQAG